MVGWKIPLISRQIARSVSEVGRRRPVYSGCIPGHKVVAGYFYPHF